MRKKRAYFKHSLWPYLLVAPQLIAIAIFILWPALSAIKLSLFRGDAFGIYHRFVGLANFIALFQSASYLHSIIVTLIFSFCVTLGAMALALLMAALTNQVLIGKKFYNTLFIWPYAVAPAVAGILWRFLFDPSIGIVSYVLDKMGYHWDYTIHPEQALFLVIAASIWQLFSYNFIFFLASLQSIPNSLIEAAAIDGASPLRRFFSITFPLLSPITFFLMVMDLIYAFFNTFGVIQIVTQGGPANATNLLVFRVYRDGFVGLNIGSSAAQSVILMIVVITLVILQFRFIEKRVHY